MSDYTIVKLDRENFSLLPPLMHDAMGREVDVQRFVWKFLDNPAGEFVGFIALSPEQEVAAYYGVIAETYEIDGVPTRIYQSCDTMTHSRHRRKGLFQQLAQHCFAYLAEQDSLFVIGFSGPMSTPGFLKMGFKAIFVMRTYFFPRLLCTFAPARPDPELQELTSVEPILELAARSNQGAAIHSRRDPAALRWRLANPTKQYRILALGAPGAYRSYVIYYEEQGKLTLFDHSFASRRDGRKLLNALKARVRAAGHLGIVCFTQEGSRYEADLRAQGFLYNPFNRGPLAEKVPFILHTTPERLARDADPARWLINAYDHDIM